MSVIRKVQAYITEHEMLHRGDVVVAAVSGGVDSMVMADVLYRLQDRLGFIVVVANFNHCLRAEAQEEAEFVSSWAMEHGLKYRLGSKDIAFLSQNCNLQDVARRERYAFLRSVADEFNATKIATAHHRDDQAETVLLHLLRGSGLSGLSGIQPLQQDVIRPLLCLTRSEIDDYARRHQIEYREDASNKSTKYLRNKIRWELLPQLREYNPNISTQLVDLAEICREDNAYLDAQAENEFYRLWSAEEKCLMPGFFVLNTSIARRVLRKAFSIVFNNAGSLSFEQVNQVLSLRDEQSCSLPGGYVAYCRQHKLYLSDQMPSLPDNELSFELLTDSEWHDLADWSWSYRACPLGGESIQNVGDRNQDHIIIHPPSESKCLWRTRLDGDSIHCSNGKTKKIKDIFIKAGVSQYERKFWPLLICDDEIMWIPFLKKSSLCKKPTSKADENNGVLIFIRKYGILKFK